MMVSYLTLMKAGPQRSKLTVDERVRRIRERLGIKDRPPADGAPYRIFIPRTADIGKPRP